MDITLFATCLVENFSPQTAQAVVDILSRLGYRVQMPRDLTCCGQPAFNAGDWEAARQMARHTLKVLERSRGPVILPSGSCTAMIRHGYPKLFAEDPADLERAQALADRTFEFSEFLARAHPAIRPQAKDADTGHQNSAGMDAHAATPTAQAAIAYHPSCHLLRTLGVDAEPKALLRAANVPFSALDETCCGFGGLFAIDQPELSEALLTRKIEEIEAGGAQVVTGCDLSCLMHIEGGLRKRGSTVRCRHLAEVLAENLFLPKESA